MPQSLAQVDKLTQLEKDEVAEMIAAAIAEHVRVKHSKKKAKK